MKKLVMAFLVVLLIAVSASAEGKKDSADTGSITMNIQHNLPISNPWQAGFEYIKEQMLKKYPNTKSTIYPNGWLEQLMIIKTASNHNIEKILPLEYTKMYVLLCSLNSLEGGNKLVVQSRIKSLRSFAVEVAHVNENVYFSREIRIKAIGI